MMIKAYFFQKIRKFCRKIRLRFFNKFTIICPGIAAVAEWYTRLPYKQVVSRPYGFEVSLKKRKSRPRRPNTHTPPKKMIKRKTAHFFFSSMGGFRNSCTQSSPIFIMFLLNLSESLYVFLYKSNSMSPMLFI